MPGPDVRFATRACAVWLGARGRKIMPNWRVSIADNHRNMMGEVKKSLVPV